MVPDVSCIFQLFELLVIPPAKDGNEKLSMYHLLWSYFSTLLFQFPGSKDLFQTESSPMKIPLKSK